MVGEHPKKNQPETILLESQEKGHIENVIPGCNSHGFHRVPAVYVQGFRLVPSKTNMKYQFKYRDTVLENRFWALEDRTHLLKSVSY